MITDYKTDTFQTKSGKELSITFLHHASLIFKFGSLYIYIDPVSDYLDNKIDFRAFPKADYMFITHEHWDHFNPETIAEIKKADTKIIVNPNVGKLLLEGTVMKNGDHLKLTEDISVDAVPAYNITPGHLEYHPEGRDNGYVFDIDSMKIYVSGDTEDIPELKNLKDIYIAFLSVNQPYTMTVEQCVAAAKVIIPKILYPYHFHGTDVEKIAEALKGSGIDVRIRDMG